MNFINEKVAKPMELKGYKEKLLWQLREGEVVHYEAEYYVVERIERCFITDKVWIEDEASYQYSKRGDNESYIAITAIDKFYKSKEILIISSNQEQTILVKDIFFTPTLDVGMYVRLREEDNLYNMIQIRNDMTIKAYNTKSAKITIIPVDMYDARTLKTGDRTFKEFDIYWVYDCDKKFIWSK